MSRSISTSKAAAAVINAIISMVGLAVSIAPLPLGADGAAAQGDQPPFAVLIVGVVLGVNGLGSLAGVASDSLTLRSLAILSVVAAALVIFLILRRDGSSAPA